MTFNWGIAIYQIVLLGLIALFFIGLYRFVNRMVQHMRNTKATLQRLEEKVDYLLNDKDKTQAK
ncbi:DUF4083 family protein [Paenibacillus sp. MER TA 81-3]|uniref:DUF4083 family protein n=1 Tax=Paenibacillus sp. MER TA 81-3 TaxID=2939573 RepID=UPI00203F3C6D|nr:DUF4083 family protein [Paenibacillus sp. MER TA 81-3]MCM3337523.1 DUF4083 family protein [Paenibacillus sp. MER TA 81-3]